MAPPHDLDEARTTTPGRRERKVAETRRAILDHARALFESQGYAGTTVEQIADAADVSNRTFFRYFPTKESLLFGDFDEIRHQMLDELRASPTRESPLRSVIRALRSLAVTLDERRDEVMWGFHMCADQNVDGVYQRSVMREDTNAQVAAFIAERLHVDIETDPRPLTWSMAIMGVFAAALKLADSSDRGAAHPGGTAALFDELLDGTADALRRCASFTR